MDEEDADLPRVTLKLTAETAARMHKAAKTW